MSSYLDRLSSLDLSSPSSLYQLLLSAGGSGFTDGLSAPGAPPSLALAPSAIHAGNVAAIITRREKDGRLGGNRASEKGVDVDAQAALLLFY